jgi:hypothetical protein
MTLPITIPNTFANATASIPLSQLDNNFSTVVVAVNGIGNGAESLSNVSITGGSVANVTLANVSISGETLDNVTLTNVSITSGNATFTTANVTTLDLTNIEVTNIKAKDGTAAIAIADSTGVTTQSTPAIISVNSASDALRITQVGSGNALLVEDSANPDSTPFVVDAGGNVVSGNTTSVAFNYASAPRFEVVGTSQSTSAIATASFNATAGVATSVLLGRGRGTVASPTVVSAGDDIGLIQFEAHDGTALIPAASILAEVDGTPGTNDMPGRLVFSTTAAGGSTPTERMRIDSAGKVGIGATPFGSTQLVLSGAAGFDAAQTTVYAARANTTMPSTGTTSQDGFGTTLVGNAASHTVTGVQHFHARSYTIGASQTVTNQHGFYANASLTGATNNYGFFSNIASGSGRWNFYANGTADNYFAGNVGIGTTSPFGTAANRTVLSINGTTDTNFTMGTGGSQRTYYYTSSSEVNLGTIGSLPMTFATNATERMRITSAGNVGIGTSSPVTTLDVTGIATVRNNSAAFNTTPNTNYGLNFQAASTGVTYITSYSGGGDTSIAFATNSGGGAAAERMRIDSSGNLLVGKTASTVTTVGGELRANGAGGFTVSGDTVLEVNRLSDDGFLVNFRQASLVEGSISVSGSTVSYNGGNLSRWAQLTTPKDDTPLFKGTVMSNLDEMNVYIAPTTYWTEEDELPEGVNVGDVKVETHEVQNEQLNKVKVSDVEGDANVAGVFVNWTYDEAHSVDEINMAMTGDMIIRIAQGVTVARGDLLMSAGDGTAKPQGDDIVRSKTIAKVTSTHVTCTYDDGSYCVPCVLMAC